MAACCSVSANVKVFNLCEPRPVDRADLSLFVSGICGLQGVRDAAARLGLRADGEFQKLHFLDHAVLQFHAQAFADVLVLKAASVDGVHSAGSPITSKFFMSFRSAQ